MLSCLYAKFRWLIFHVQLSLYLPSFNVLRPLTDSRGDTAVHMVYLIIESEARHISRN